jgi:GT2 family glycosyltransferase
MKENKPFVSVLIGTRDRPIPLRRCLDSILTQSYPWFEVLVLDDNSQKFDICNEVVNYVNDRRVQCFRAKSQLGVAGGRNFLAQRAQGEILVFLDDDAYFDNERCLERIVHHFSENPCLGAIAFKIIVYKEQHTDLQIPFSRYARRKWPELSEKARLCSYYIGAGHALRREVFERWGMYQANSMFYGEELDLAYRMIQQGFCLLYAPDIVVHHKPEASVLESKQTKGKGEFYFTVRNRIQLAYKYLPFPYLPIHLLVWISYYILMAIKGKKLLELCRGAWAGIKELNRERRSVLGQEAIAYLKANFGRLWY